MPSAIPAAMQIMTVKNVLFSCDSSEFITSFILIWKRFYVDTLNMEIISYSEETSSKASKNPRVQLKPSLFRAAKAVRQTQSVAVAVPMQHYSLRGEIQIAISAIERTFHSVQKYLWILPILALCILVPVTVSNIMAYVESFARVVSFDSTNTADADFLDNTLSSFALNGVGAYASDGTVLSSDGSVLSSDGNDSVLPEVSFKLPVTFKTYKVKSGETIDSISRKFGLANISTLIAVNNISNVRSLYSGQKLRVPSTDGIVHVVARGETLNGLSVKYKVTVEDLLDVNDLTTDTLSVGNELFIPGVRLDTTSLQRAMGELFAYPIKAKWHLSDKFGMRIYPFTGQKSMHTGIDMACPTGTPIKAAMSGTVAFTGVSVVYGNYVIIKHYDGYQTLYGHMSKIIAKKGQSVNQSTTIGLVGSTGQSTGPHLHFSVYKNGKLVDPLTVLK